MNVRRRLQRRMLTHPLPYQIRGVRFAERYRGRVLIADDMGLGKTYQAIGWLVIHREIRPTVIVCPASVKYHWQRELSQHAGLRSLVCEGRMGSDRQSRIRAKRAHRYRVLIINYDILSSWLPVLLELKPRLLVVDECHYAKNRGTKRTKACRALAHEAKHVIALSGTPIEGRPIEFFSVLQMLRPKEFPSLWKYAFEFCAPKRNRWSGGWDFSGASNLDRLRKRLKTIMIRRLKRQVLKDLPPKTRTVLPVDIDNREEYEEAEENFLSWLLKQKGPEAWNRAIRAEAIVKMGGLRLLAARGKIGTAIQWVRDWLESSKEKLLVFAVHRTILSQMSEAFPEALVIDGSVGAKKRQEIVDRFQRDSRTHLLFGQLRAAGIGLNLTAASNVLFLEVGWTPGQLDQAEDRVLRIGQQRKVSVYYMVGNRTIEERILGILQAKDETMTQILNGRKGGTMNLAKLLLARKEDPNHAEE